MVDIAEIKFSIVSSKQKINDLIIADTYFVLESVSAHKKAKTNNFSGMLWKAETVISANLTLFRMLIWL